MVNKKKNENIIGFKMKYKEEKEFSLTLYHAGCVGDFLHKLFVHFGEPNPHGFV